MPYRHVLWTAYAVAFLLMSGTHTAIAETPPRPDSGTTLGRILDEWHRRSSASTSVDVLFNGEARSRAWGVEPYDGRVTLGPKGKAAVSLVRHRGKDNAISTERLIWTNDEYHRFLSMPESKVHVLAPIAATDRGRLPAVFALPFLWNSSVEDLERRYHVELLKEDAETCTLAFTPLPGSGPSAFSKAFLQLDRRTYLPRRYFTIDPNGKDSKDYRATEARRDLRIPEEVFRIPGEQGWDLIDLSQGGLSAWVARAFQQVLLP